MKVLRDCSLQCGPVFSYPFKHHISLMYIRYLKSQIVTFKDFYTHSCSLPVHGRFFKSQKVLPTSPSPMLTNLPHAGIVERPCLCSLKFSLPEICHSLCLILISFYANKIQMPMKQQKRWKRQEVPPITPISKSSKFPAQVSAGHTYSRRWHRKIYIQVHHGDVCQNNSTGTCTTSIHRRVSSKSFAAVEKRANRFEILCQW